MKNIAEKIFCIYLRLRTRNGNISFYINHTRDAKPDFAPQFYVKSDTLPFNSIVLLIPKSLIIVFMNEPSTIIKLLSYFVYVHYYI